MGNFASKARSAVIWNTGFNLFRDLLHFATMLVLVRLLPPEAYGQFGFVTSVVGFLSIFAFGNFIAHVLQVKSVADARFQEHFTAGAVLNISMFVIANLIALGFRWIPQWSTIAPMLHVMSVTFLLEWPCEIRRKMIEREFDWKTLRILHSSGLVLTTASALCMAWAGFGTYALLVPGMAVTLPFIFDLFFRMRWRPTWSWSWQDYKPCFEFALPRIGSGLVLNGRILLESTILAALLGFSGLGMLNRSLGLAQLFCLKIATQLVYAIYPILTRIEDQDGNTARVGSLVLQTVVWTTLPLAVSFSVLADPLVRLIYGEQWLDAVALVPWAMAWGVASALFHAAYMLLLARHKPKLCFTADVCVLTGSGLALWMLLPQGTLFYLIGVLLSQILALLLVLFHLFRLKSLTHAGLMKPMAAGIIGVATAAVSCSALFGYIWPSIQYSLLHALSWGITFFVIYAVILRLFFSKHIHNIIPYLPLQANFRKLLCL